MFSEYTAPSTPFILCDYMDSANSIISDPTKIAEKYLTFPEQAFDRNYIMSIAQKDPQILVVAEESIKNDGDLFLTLFRKKHSVAAYIGHELRNDTKFLLAMDKIDPICWKHFTKHHFIAATFEQKLYQWCLYQLSIYEYKEKKVKLKRSFELENSIYMGLMAAFEKINVLSKKQDIINYIDKCDCYVYDPYYKFSIAEIDVAKSIAKYNYALLYKIDDYSKWCKNYEFVYFLWEHIRLTAVWGIAFNGIKNFPDDKKLAKLILEQRQYGSAIKFFSENIRGDKAFILSLIQNGILQTQDLFYLCDSLKHDEDIIQEIKRNPTLYNDWQRYEKYYKNRKKG